EGRVGCGVQANQCGVGEDQDGRGLLLRLNGGSKVPRASHGGTATGRTWTLGRLFPHPTLASSIAFNSERLIPCLLHSHIYTTSSSSADNRAVPPISLRISASFSRPISISVNPIPMSPLFLSPLRLSTATQLPRPDLPSTLVHAYLGWFQ